MDFSTFETYFLEELKKELNEKVQLRIVPLEKNNQVRQRALLLEEIGHKGGPAVYLEGLYERFLEGSAVSELVTEVAQMYANAEKKSKINLDFFLKYPLVKDRIYVKLIGAAENTELLEKIPHRKVLNLAICYYYSLQDEDCALEGTILIREAHRALWHVEEADLFAAAMENSLRDKPPVFHQMERFLAQDAEAPVAGEDLPFYILSNANGYFGAACMLYPGILAAAYEKMQGDFYVIPSSVHEVLLVSAHMVQDGADLQDILQIVNKTQLLPEEYLSDRLYFYDAKKEVLSML